MQNVYDPVPGSIILPPSYPSSSLHVRSMWSNRVHLVVTTWWAEPVVNSDGVCDHVPQLSDLDLTTWCPVHSTGTLVLRDAHHLSSSFADTQHPGDKNTPYYICGPALLFIIQMKDCHLLSKASELCPLRSDHGTRERKEPCEQGK
jgi:hypothetical protein